MDLRIRYTTIYVVIIFDGLIKYLVPKCAIVLSRFLYFIIHKKIISNPIYIASAHVQACKTCSRH